MLHALAHMKFAVLGSGSRGNAAVVAMDEMMLLIDAGLSAKQLNQRMELLDIKPSALAGILLTHEHGDHVRGLKILLKQNPDLHVYATAATARVVREVGIREGHWHVFEAGQVFSVGEAQITSFAIQHDAVDPVGFVISNKNKRLGFLSDAGCVPRSVVEHLRELSGIFLEANYDVEMLEMDLKRPWAIKQRISSRHGHLSNEQVAELLTEIAHPQMSHIILGHLSSDCNHPQTAKQAVSESLQEINCAHLPITCILAESASSWFSI